MGFSPQISNFPCQQGFPPSRIYYQKFHLCIFNLIDQFSNHFLSASASCYFSNLLWLYIFIYILRGPKNGLQQASTDQTLWGWCAFCSWTRFIKAIVSSICCYVWTQYGCWLPCQTWLHGEGQEWLPKYWKWWLL